MRTVLILGANAGQTDLIRYFKEKGWRVLSCSSRKGEPGARYSDKYIWSDATDIKAISSIVAEESVQLVFSISSDFLNYPVAVVSKKFLLPYFFEPEFVATLNNKVLLRKHLLSQNLCDLKFIAIDSADQCAEWSLFPCVIKPSDSQGQRGVFKAHDAMSLADSAKASLSISPTHTAIIEQYCTGIELSCNTLLCDGKLIVCEFSERLSHANDYFFGLPRGHIMPPGNISKDDIHAAERLVRQVIKSLSIRNGPLYFQMIVTSNGPKIVEIAPRIDGCHLWRLIKYVRGFDYIDLTIRCLLGEKLTPQYPPNKVQQTHLLHFQKFPPGHRLTKKDLSIPNEALYYESHYKDGGKVLTLNGKNEVVGYSISTIY